VIVGSYLNSSSEQEALLLTGTVSGGAWTFTASAAGLPSGAAASPGASLSSVSCAASGDCSAAGSYENAGEDEQGLLVSQTGSVWETGTTASLPADASSNPGVTLSSISCASAGDCDAVGDYYTSGGNLQGLMLTQTGGGWGSAAEPTLPSDAGTAEFTSLASVSCSAASNCAATGNYADESFSLHPLLLSQSSNGTWSAGTEPALPYPNASPEASVEAVSCAPGGGCAEVADYTDRSDNQLAGATSGTTTAAAIPALSLSAPPELIETGTVLAASAATATLSGGASETGSVTFTIFGPQDSPPSSCAYGGTTIGTATVSGDGSYDPAQGFTASSPGDYWWYASYGGDLDSAPATSTCSASMHETVVQSPAITVKAPPASPPNVTISHTALVASLSGVVAHAGGSLTFTVFGPESTAPTNCSVGGTQVGSDTVDGNGNLSPPGGFTPASAGDYWWYVSYTGDGSDPAAASTCGAQMAETVVSVPAQAPTTTPVATTPVATTPTTTAGIKPPANANARIAKITTTASALLVTLTCRASSRQSCAGAITATTTEPGSADAQREKATKRSRERVVTIGTVTYKLSGGSSRKVSLKLNRLGTDLLKSLHKIIAVLKLRQGQSTVSRTVTFHSGYRAPFTASRTCIQLLRAPRLRSSRASTLKCSPRLRCGDEHCESHGMLSRQARESIQHEAARNRNVKARALPDHRDLHAEIGGFDVFIRDAMPFVAEQHDRALHGRLESRKRDRVLSEFHGHDSPAVSPLLLNPSVLARTHPMDAWSAPVTERVAVRERVTVVLGIWDRNTRANCITGPQQSA
jgi:hypothetical protein